MHVSSRDSKADVRLPALRSAVAAHRAPRPPEVGACVRAAAQHTLAAGVLGGRPLPDVSGHVLETVRARAGTVLTRPVTWNRASGPPRSRRGSRPLRRPTGTCGR